MVACDTTDPKKAAKKNPAARKGAGVRKRKLEKRKLEKRQRWLDHVARGEASAPSDAALAHPNKSAGRVTVTEKVAIVPPRLQPAATSLAAPTLPIAPPFESPAWDLRYEPDVIEQQLQLLLDEPVLGIDVEWRPTFVAGQAPHKVALVQISSATECVLVPVKHLRRLPPSLSRLLANPQVWKVGCGVGEDARKLETDYGLRCEPTVELGNVAVRMQGTDGVAFPFLPAGEKLCPGLRGLALALGHDLAKPKSVSRSNWERRPLTDVQQRYAALDAYAVRPSLPQRS